MGIFTTALRNKKIQSNSQLNTSPCFHRASLTIWPLTMLKITHFSELLISRFTTYEKDKATDSISERPIREEKNLSSKWSDGHKSNAKPKQIYCNFISIYYQFNPHRETDDKPKFASKISSLDVSNDPRTHSPRQSIVENELGNPASFAYWASPGTTSSLIINKLF